MRRATFKDWFLLFRPWSYTATVVPFLVVSGLFGGYGPSTWRWWLALAAALPLQAACNLLNTWGDERSGVDDVPGAVRTTPQVHEGSVSMRAVLTAAIGCVVISGLLAIPLFFVRGANGGMAFNWPLLVISLIGLFGACNYATGVKFKYHGLGVPFVFFLMGTIEMAGVFCASALCTMAGGHDSVLVMGDACSRQSELWLLVAALSIPVNCLVAVIMHGNDMRDIPSDRAAGIKTVASMLGPKGALLLYTNLHSVPYAVVVSVFVSRCLTRASFGVFDDRQLWLLLPLAAFPLTIRTLRTAKRVYDLCPENPPWRGLERASGGIHFVFGVLYAIALQKAAAGA